MSRKEGRLRGLVALCALFLPACANAWLEPPQARRYLNLRVRVVLPAKGESASAEAARTLRLVVPGPGPGQELRKAPVIHAVGGSVDEQYDALGNHILILRCSQKHEKSFELGYDVALTLFEKSVPESLASSDTESVRRTRSLFEAARQGDPAAVCAPRGTSALLARFATEDLAARAQEGYLLPDVVCRDLTQLTSLHSWIAVDLPGFGWLPVDPCLARRAPRQASRAFGGQSRRRLQLSRGDWSSADMDGRVPADKALRLAAAQMGKIDISERLEISVQFMDLARWR